MSNPFHISKQYNDVMCCWDLQVQVGGFETESDADDAAKRLAEWLGENGKVERVQ